MFGFPKRGQAGIHPAPPTPLTIRLRHIDNALASLASRPRDPINLAAIDVWLDRRLTLRPGGEGGSR